MFSVVENYDLTDVACHDVMEESVDLHQKWFSYAKGGSCLDKQGMEIYILTLLSQ